MTRAKAGPAGPPLARVSTEQFVAGIGLGIIAGGLVLAGARADTGLLLGSVWFLGGFVAGTLLRGPGRPPREWLENARPLPEGARAEPRLRVVMRVVAALAVVAAGAAIPAVLGSGELLAGAGGGLAGWAVRELRFGWLLRRRERSTGTQLLAETGRFVYRADLSEADLYVGPPVPNRQTRTRTATVPRR